MDNLAHTFRNPQELLTIIVENPKCQVSKKKIIDLRRHYRKEIIDELESSQLSM